MIVAKFSNGHSDPYKGSRDVKAAWLITFPDRSTMSGHSLDRAKAEKTARSNIALYCPHRELKMIGGRRGGRHGVTPAALAYFNKVAAEAGFCGYKAYNADAKKKRITWAAQCKIEIVEIQE